MTRECTCCGRVLPIERFSRNKSGLYGRKAQCSECENSLQIEFRKIKQSREMMAKYHNDQIEKNLEEAKRRGLSYGQLKAERRRINELEQQGKRCKS